MRGGSIDRMNRFAFSNSPFQRAKGSLLHRVANDGVVVQLDESVSRGEAEGSVAGGLFDVDELAGV